MLGEGKTHERGKTARGAAAVVTVAIEQAGVLGELGLALGFVGVGIPVGTVAAVVFQRGGVGIGVHASLPGRGGEGLIVPAAAHNAVDGLGMLEREVVDAVVTQGAADTAIGNGRHCGERSVFVDKDEGVAEGAGASRLSVCTRSALRVFKIVADALLAPQPGEKLPVGFLVLHFERMRRQGLVNGPAMLDVGGVAFEDAVGDVLRAQVLKHLAVALQGAVIRGGFQGKGIARQATVAAGLLGMGDDAAKAARAVVSLQNVDMGTAAQQVIK